MEDEYQRTSGILSSGGELVALYQGTTSQLAEKLIRAVGRDFSPGIKQVKSTVALATEVCFRMFCLKTGFFSKLFSRAENGAKSRRTSQAAEKLVSISILKGFVSGHDFSRADKANHINVGL